MFYEEMTTPTPEPKEPQETLPSKKLMRLRIDEQRLIEASERATEASLERLQRGAALREQEAEYAFNNERRLEMKASMQRESRRDLEIQRPYVFVETMVYYDEDEQAWACEHCGVMAHGDTPSMACENFDHLWVFGK